MAWSIGIDVGGTNIAFGLVDDRYRIIDRGITKTGAPRSASSLADSMAGGIRQLLAGNLIKLSQVDSIGLGLPGLVDEKTDLLMDAPNLFLKHIDFKALLGQHFPDTRIKIGNDGDCAVWGEYLAGEASSYESALLLTLGTGIGGGFVCEGRIFRGAAGLGIEPGHLVIEAENGPLCTCGRPGCLEMYTSIRGLNRLLQERLQHDNQSALGRQLKWDAPSSNVRVFFDAVASADPVALEVLDRYAGFLAGGIRTLTVLYRPHVILLGGGMSRAGDVLLEALCKALDPEKSGDYILSLPPVALSRLGNDAGIIGAAMLHREGLSR